METPQKTMWFRAFDGFFPDYLLATRQNFLLQEGDDHDIDFTKYRVLFRQKPSKWSRNL